MKPLIIMVMLHDAAGDCRQGWIVVSHELRRSPRSQPHFAVDHAQPVGRGRAGKHVRLMHESIAVSKVIQRCNSKPLA